MCIFALVEFRIGQEGRCRAWLMAGSIVCLRGWHSALAKAEVESLFPNNRVIALESPRIVALEGELDLRQAVINVNCSSGIQALLTDCVIMDWDNSNKTRNQFITDIKTVIEESDKTGTIGVFSWRQEGRIKGLSGSGIASSVGGIATNLGYSINLDNPDHKLGIMLDGSSNKVICGWMLDANMDSSGLSKRRATERPFFKPISLDPKLARLVVNLAGGPIDGRIILDPMTGTGGFAIEAATMGRNIIALDTEKEMVAGTSENLEWALNTPKSVVEIIQGDATQLSQYIPKQWNGKISGVVLDPPYGRNSHGTISHSELLKNTLKSVYEVCTEDANLVLILPIKPIKTEQNKQLIDESLIELLHGDWNDFTTMLRTSGWKIKGRWSEHVHSSLSRLILHATISPQD